jgi:hypothetical protein
MSRVPTTNVLCVVLVSFPMHKNTAYIISSKLQLIFIIFSSCISQAGFSILVHLDPTFSPSCSLVNISYTICENLIHTPIHHSTTVVSFPFVLLSFFSYNRDVRKWKSKHHPHIQKLTKNVE